MRIIFFLILICSITSAQTVYEIPFASEGNEIELEVLNDSEINLVNVAVTAIEIPEWVKFASEQEVVSEIKSNQNGKTIFSFDIDKEAAILEEKTLKFQISGNDQVWNKEIKISILPPDKFELNQNYPNPFNPTTTISYTIPGSSAIGGATREVHLAIYDILGRQVEVLVDENQKSGFYKFNWNAGHLASGMYIYQVSIKAGNSNSEVIRKKMMLMK